MERIIHQNENGKIALKPEEKLNGLYIALVDEKGTPLAKYNFNEEKLNNVHGIAYRSSNVRISFNIDPTTTCELGPSQFP